MSEENQNKPAEEKTEKQEQPNAEPKKVETANAKSGADYVKEAFDCFLKGKPKDTEPLSVIRDFYEKNASPELKEKCKADGKTVEGAYAFMCEVAHKAGGKSISDSIGLSICMHYFQDVPALADFEPALKKAEKAKREAEERAFVKRTMASRLKEIAASQKGVDRIKEIKTAGCTIVLAKSQEELRKEGRKMNNCVGSGRYGRGIVHGDTLILMFRDEKGKAWCDAEIDRRSWRVLQVYAKGNEIAPKEIADLADQIACELRSMHEKHVKDKKFPELLQRKVA